MCYKRAPFKDYGGNQKVEDYQEDPITDISWDQVISDTTYMESSVVGRDGGCMVIQLNPSWSISSNEID